MWLFSCFMQHEVHQPVANCVCLLVGAEQVVYSGLSTENQNNELKGPKKALWC